MKGIVESIIGKERIKRFSCHSFRHMNITRNIKKYGIEYARINSGHDSILAT